MQTGSGWTTWCTDISTAFLALNPERFSFFFTLAKRDSVLFLGFLLLLLFQQPTANTVETAEASFYHVNVNKPNIMS